MISEDFRKTGWQIVHETGQITRYQVFGERSSGTNFVKRLIGRNSALTPTEDLGWKHGFPHMTAIPHDTVVVACVRDPRAWSLSMHAKPWHTPPQMQALPFPAFIRAPWATVVDRKRYFPAAQVLGGVGAPLQHDRHPVTGAVFDNLFALRRAKLQGLLSFLQRGCSVVLCRMEAVQTAPEAFLSALHAGLDLPAEDRPYRPVVKRLGAKFLPSVDTRPETPKALSAEDIAFMHGVLDPATEQALGYLHESSPQS